MPDDFDSVDPLPLLQSQIDQMLAMSPELARAAWGTFNAYLAEGFSANQALYLTAVGLQESPGNAPS
jgi:hypothetical protein